MKRRGRPMCLPSIRVNCIRGEKRTWANTWIRPYIYIGIGCGLAVVAWGFYLLMYAGYQMLGGQ
jgi:hypothetical protein